MAVLAKFKITQSGETGVLVLTIVEVAKWPLWYMETPVKWFPSNGTWATIRNATKFRQWYEMRLMDGDGNYCAHFSPPPYTLGSKWQESLMGHSWVIQYDTGEKFDVEVTQATPIATKGFKIRENWATGMSYGIAQTEGIGLEIQDPGTGVSAFYKYRGFGLGLSVPGAPKIGGGLSTPGDWNDFTAPGYMSPSDFAGTMHMTTPANVGVGTSYSYNILDIDAAPYGFQVNVHIAGFSTGNTISLPSAGGTMGSLELVTAPKEEPKMPLGGHGKFGNAGR